MKKALWILLTLNIILLLLILFSLLGALVTVKFSIEGVCQNSMIEFIYLHSYVNAALGIIVFLINVIGIAFLLKKVKKLSSESTL